MDIKKKDIFIFLLSSFLCILVYLIVFYTGGTSHSFTHLFYFPIIFSSFYGNWLNTLFTPLFSAILLSRKFMPAYVDQNIMQYNITWIFRGVIFIIIAIIVKNGADYIRKKERLNIIKSKQMIAFQKAAFNSILNLAEAIDPEITGRHLERLADYAAILLENMNISSIEKENIISAIPFHDIGKIAIPDDILHKPGKLTDLEFEIVKQHTTIGGEILYNIEKSLVYEEDLRQMIKTARELTYFHHERYDGGGYPQGLKGDEIPFAARVTALCDVYDALSSKRPYKDPIPHDQCVEIIKEGRGTQFDEKIVDQFLIVQHKFKYIAENFKDENIYVQQKVLKSVNTIIKNKNKILKKNS